MKSSKIIGLVGLSILIGACAKKDGDDRLRERAKIQSEGENKITEEKAKKLNYDLQRRYAFVKGVSDNFEGSFTLGKATYKMYFRLSANMAIVDTGRVKTIEELTSELNALGVNAQVSITDGYASSGCNYVNIKPDIIGGMIDFFSDECPLRLTVYLSDAANPSHKDLSETSKVLSEKLMNKTQSGVEYLNVNVQSVHNPESYSVNVMNVSN